jgi:hypothetical protein
MPELINMTITNLSSRAGFKGFQAMDPRRQRRSFMRKIMARPTNDTLRVRYRSPTLRVSNQATDWSKSDGSPRSAKIPTVEAIMRKQNYADRAKLSPARIFKSPMDVVEASNIAPAEKLAILKAWEADERALLRAEDEGMGGGEHAHLHKVQAALNHLS